MAAVVWVGGGLCFTILTILAGRDGRRLLSLLETLAPLGLVMMPASLTVLLTGGALVWIGAWGFQAWIVLALAAALISFVMGATILGPTLSRIATLKAEGDVVGALAQADRLVWPGRAEQALFILVVCLMVAKPGWAEMPAIGALAVALFAGVVLINTRGPRPTLA
ncbi:hypothetical protein [Wenxinia marina]|nr:hypothetical protein [Wenxinia marina]